MGEIKDGLLQRRFIDSAIRLAEIHLDEDLTQKEKEMRMEGIWKDFKRYIDDNYEER